MNRTPIERYYERASEELGQSLWDTDMLLYEETTWCYCRFLSQKKQLVYIMAIYTGAQAFHDLMFDTTYDEVLASTPNFETLPSVEVMANVKARMQERVQNDDRLPYVWEGVLKDRVSKHKVGRRLLKAIVNVPVITEEVVTSVVQSFLLDHDERSYSALDPIDFDKESMIQYLDPFKLIRTPYDCINDEYTTSNETDNNGC